MLRLEDIDAEALAELRDCGYDPKTGEEALSDAMRMLGVSAMTATVFLTGEGDLVKVPSPRSTLGA